MSQGEKKLLLKDLCARLPHGVKYQTYLGDIFTLKDITLNRTTTQYYIDDNAFNLSQIKPYLRPMASMTEEEENEYRAINCYEGLFPHNEDAFDYVLSHHFDYRGLIEKGLALEAPEGMYKK